MPTKMMKPRMRKFISLLPKYNYAVMPAAIEAGYSQTYAHKQGKRLMNAAMKAQTKEVLATRVSAPVPTEEARRTLADMIGLSRQEVFEALRNIALNSKDLTSALKVLKPLSKDLGADLSEEENAKIVVPVLNIGVRERETPLTLSNGDNMALPSLSTDNIDCATLEEPLIEPSSEAIEVDDSVYER